MMSSIENVGKCLLHLNLERRLTNHCPRTTLDCGSAQAIGRLIKGKALRIRLYAKFT